MNKKKAIFPGSFNPFHEGHKDVLKQALDLFDIIYIAVTINSNKKQKIDVKECAKEIKEKVKEYKNVEVIINTNKLTADLAREINCSYLIRGLRNSEDLEYELNLSDANSYINKELKTIFFVTDKEKRKISSTLINEIENIKNKLKG